MNESGRQGIEQSEGSLFACLFVFGSAGDRTQGLTHASTCPTHEPQLQPCLSFKSQSRIAVSENLFHFHGDFLVSVTSEVEGIVGPFIFLLL